MDVQKPPTAAIDSLPRLDHIGILVRDLDSAIAQWTNRFDVEVARRFEAPAMNIVSVFLNTAGAEIELYTIEDVTVLDIALGDATAKLDHVALRLHRVDGPELIGCAIRGPGRREPIAAPIVIGSATHVWTEPPGIDVLLQLIRPGA
ncbi:VOC family protein [Rhodococcus fascians]|nr:VOC family protein [Rhodococcus fascians]MBY4238669.1 VOC family protein [Rhodococcus fascians]MBY4254742.1 VOC family protein [Rhodococcus fascians]MBY4270024.1 VOC family protein [Rhodococcus fascians]